MSDEEKLIELGFETTLVYGSTAHHSYWYRERALEATRGSGFQAALDWIADHQDSQQPTVPDEPEHGEGINPASLHCNECDKSFSSLAIAQFHAAKTGHQDFSESENAIRDLTPPQKAQRLVELREKLAEKRRQEELRVEKEAKEMEVLRRKGGQMATEARREVAEREIKKAAEQLRKDKEEEKVIRARIRTEMEAERRLRQERTRPAEAGNVLQNLLDPISPTSQNPEAARIQVRFPNGATLKATFKSDEKLSGLLDKISETTEITENSRLTVPFPHRTIQLNTECGKTLKELGLCPSASLIFE